MNDEIKEIIEYFKDDIDYLEEELKHPNFKGRYITIRDKECEYLRKLLDNITNLQEKVNQYENPDDMALFYMWLDTKAKDKIKELQEENKELEAKLEMYENGVYFSSENDKLQERIDKAIEFIEEHNIIGTNKEYLSSGIEKCYSLELMEILQGSDKE